jgi:calcineurin-like phosphoesterase family protein
MASNQFKIYLLSDTHFGHDNIIKFCQRPDNHEEVILNNISKTLSKNDILIHLGDFAFGKEMDKWLQRYSGIPCRKWHIRGNHDFRGYNTYLNYFDFVGDTFSLNYQKLNIIFSHKPINVLGGDNDINIHGHLHNSNHHSYDYYSNKNINVSVEVIDYTPILLDDIISKYKLTENI